MTPNPPVDSGAIGTPPTAGELFAHGLLSMIHADAAGSEGRVRRALDVIGRETASRAEERLRAIRLPRVRPLAAAAGLLLVAFTAALFTLSTERQAQALVRASIRALHADGDRLFRARRQRAETLPLTTAATIYARGDLLLFHHQALRRDIDVVAGRDHLGPWAIDADERIVRDNPFRRLPLWLARDEPEQGSISFFTDTPEEVLAELKRSYRIEQLPVESHPDRPDLRCERIAAIKDRPGRPGLFAGRIDFWIDPVTRIPERIELGEFPSGVRRPPGHPPPPFRVVIDRVDTPPLADDWFDARRWGQP